MPVQRRSSYIRPPSWQFNAHLQTILPNLRAVRGVRYERERIDTPDGDFMDLDWIIRGHARLLILSHGLEGSSERAYMRSAAKFFSARGWDVLAWNCRSCSGEMNRTAQLYHHGETGDVRFVIDHVRKKGGYRRIALSGYSLGGSILLNYFGRHPDEIPDEVVGGVAFSVPCDLKSCALRLDERQNWMYKYWFRRSLTQKFKAKNAQFPGLIPIEKLNQVKHWYDFDNYLSAPLIGFRDAEEYYDQASCYRYLSKIGKPVLLVNALNDPILGKRCFPFEIAEKSDVLFLETPDAGGHVGFSLPAEQEFSWMEYRALDFLDSLCI